jgi:hypothetical protein
MAKSNDGDGPTSFTRREFVALTGASVIVSSPFFAQPSAAAVPLKETLKVTFDWRDLKHRAWENQITARLRATKDIVAKIFEHRKQEAAGGVRSAVIDLVIEKTSTRMCPALGSHLNPRYRGRGRHGRRCQKATCSFGPETCEIGWGVLHREAYQIADEAISRGPPCLDEEYEVSIDVGRVSDLAEKLDKIFSADAGRGHAAGSPKRLGQFGA